jgi:hypothetical protein
VERSVGCGPCHAVSMSCVMLTNALIPLSEPIQRIVQIQDVRRIELHQQRILDAYGYQPSP